MLIVARKRYRGMGRNADGAGDLFAPAEIGEEVLAEALASHVGNSVARDVTPDWCPVTREAFGTQEARKKQNRKVRPLRPRG